MRITVIGGHGKVALLLAPLLVAAGHEVRSVIRNPEHEPDIEATGATPVVHSVEEADLAQLTDLFTGQDAIVWSAGAGGGDPARTVAVDQDAAIRSMDAAAAAGVPRYVMVSFSAASPAHLVADDDPFRVYQDAKITADEHLRTSDLDWTILGPGPLTLERAGGVNPSAAAHDGDRTSRELVAQVIAAALETPATYRRTLVLGDGDVPIGQWLASLG